MVIWAERVSPVSLFSTVTVTLPLPVPLAGETVIQLWSPSGTAVVQAHSAWVAVTVTG